jgi:hypothetical protein
MAGPALHDAPLSVDTFVVVEERATATHLSSPTEYETSSQFMLEVSVLDVQLAPLSEEVTADVDAQRKATMTPLA